MPRICKKIAELDSADEAKEVHWGGRQAVNGPRKETHSQRGIAEGLEEEVEAEQADVGKTEENERLYQRTPWGFCHQPIPAGVYVRWSLKDQPEGSPKPVGFYVRQLDLEISHYDIKKRRIACRCDTEISPKVGLSLPGAHTHEELQTPSGESVPPWNSWDEPPSRKRDAPASPPQSWNDPSPPDDDSWNDPLPWNWVREGARGRSNSEAPRWEPWEEPPPDELYDERCDEWNERISAPPFPPHASKTPTAEDESESDKEFMSPFEMHGGDVIRGKATGKGKAAGKGKSKGKAAGKGKKAGQAAMQDDLQPDEDEFGPNILWDPSIRIDLSRFEDEIWHEIPPDEDDFQPDEEDPPTPPDDRQDSEEEPQTSNWVKHGPEWIKYDPWQQMGPLQQEASQTQPRGEDLALDEPQTSKFKGRSRSPSASSSTSGSLSMPSPLPKRMPKLPKRMPRCPRVWICDSIYK